ncbi:MAG TPA: acyltransferase [Burkholderiales bacterium]|nr:acyltransferase [Burkholderiales bacterium]
MYYQAVQVLRGIAATGVVFAHAAGFYPVNAHGEWDQLILLGAGGVDLFFVISGFIMASISRFFSHDPITPAEFFTRRIIRIVPLYWFYTTLFLAAYVLYGSRPDLWNALGSYLFVPYPRANGAPYPVVAVGWTLNLEMMFYLVFGCSLLLDLRSRVVFVTGIILAFSAWALLLPVSLWWELWFANPLYLEFLYGMLIGWLTFNDFRLPQYAAWACVIGGFALFPLFPDVRALSWGLCSMLIVLGAVSIKQKMPALLILVGDASYSIYLSHLLIVPAAHAILPVDDASLRISLVVVISVAVGVLAYKWIEKPLLQFVRRAALSVPREPRMRSR